MRTGWRNQFHPTPINSVKQPGGREEKPEINSSCFTGLTGYFRLFRSICWLMCSVAAVPAKCHMGTLFQGRPYREVTARGGRPTVGSGGSLARLTPLTHAATSVTVRHSPLANGESPLTASFAECLLWGPFTNIITWLLPNQQGRNRHPSPLFPGMSFLERAFTWLASSEREWQPSNPPLSLVNADILWRVLLFLDSLVAEDRFWNLTEMGSNPAPTWGTLWNLYNFSEFLPFHQRQILFWGGSKITAYGDCGHEIKRCLLLGRKTMTNIDSVLKNRDITLWTNVHVV